MQQSTGFLHHIASTFPVTPRHRNGGRLNRTGATKGVMGLVERSIHADPVRTPPGVPVPAPSDASVPAHEPPPVLWTEGLRKQFGAMTAVRDVSLRVRQGDVFGFLGPNGSGKTTTMAIILGLVAPTAGQIALFGQTTPAGRATALARVGAFIESPGFYPYLSGLAPPHALSVSVKLGGATSGTAGIDDGVTSGL